MSWIGRWLHTQEADMAPKKKAAEVLIEKKLIEAAVVEVPVEEAPIEEAPIEEKPIEDLGKVSG